ncbi:serine hydrolase domain-containing protein [Paenibacillus septentrionalis]|uniref:Serine hydrolase domain-containing protein n=1 Tax=Paenibacillus septentrionalis TaxID=429342 RepID=A0ABW1V5H5_9BACL
MDTYKLVDVLNSNKLSSFIMQQNGEVVLHHELQANASEALMPINSCTKSIVSALYCIGLSEGWLPSIDRNIVEWFPELEDSQDKRKLNITVEHVLTLTAGFQWDEFGGNKNFPRMTRSRHWLDYVLAQPLAADPGTKWSYNSGISQLLSALVVRASGRELDKIAEEKLFGPLGISQYRWKTDPQGIHTGGYGMELTAMDMLKFGQLFLQQGYWNEKQLIRSEICKQATTPYIQVEAPESGRYGWHWWCDEGNGVSYYYARGYGGQFIIIVPSVRAVIVSTRDQKHKARSGLDIFREMILPDLQ